MSTKRSRLLAVFVALAMAAMTLPLAPAASADQHHTQECVHDAEPHETGYPYSKEEPFRKSGWIMLAHSETNDSIRISQTLFLRVFNEGGLVGNIEQGTFNARMFSNGIDAYVIELPCQTSEHPVFDDDPLVSHQTYCLERLDPNEDGYQGGVPLQNPPVPPDMRIAFYDQFINLVGDLDPDVPPIDTGEDEDEMVCDDVPVHASYAVVYLETEDVQMPRGLQLLGHHEAGTWTEHFNFYFYQDEE